MITDKNNQELMTGQTVRIDHLEFKIEYFGLTDKIMACGQYGCFDIALLERQEMESVKI